MNVEKMKEVFSDEAFVKSLFELEMAAQVQAALQEKGVELSEEEILSIRDMLGKVERGEITQEQLADWQKQAADGELSDEALEQVAGGFMSMAAVLVSVGIAFLITGGVGAGVGVGLTAGVTNAVERRW